MHSQSSDFEAWREPNESGVPQTWVIGINGYCYHKGYGYGSGSYQTYINAINRTVDGESSDTEPPELYYKFPADGATGVITNITVKARAKDDGFGVDISTFDLTVTVNGSPVSGDITLESGSNFLDYKVKFNADDPYPELTEVTVHVEADDLVGNSMDESWSFTTGEESGIKTASLGEIKAVFK